MTFKDETTTKNFVNFRNTMQIINCLWWNTIRVDQNDLPRILCLIFKAKRLLKANFDLIFSYYPEKLLRCITLGFGCRKYKNLLCAWERTLKMKCFQTLLIETLQWEKIWKRSKDIKSVIYMEFCAILKKAKNQFSKKKKKITERRCSEVQTLYILTFLSLFSPL